MKKIAILIILLVSASVLISGCVDNNDTPDDIATKVFAAECEAFPEAINLVAEKSIDYFWSRVKP